MTSVHSESNFHDQVEQLERDLGVDLPPEYRAHLSRYNTATPDPNSFKIPGTDGFRLQVYSFLGFADVVNASIRPTYQMIRSHIPADLLPIATLTRPGFVCIGIAGDLRGKIFIADAEGLTDPGEAIQIADSFEEFLEAFDDEGEIDEKDEGGWTMLHRAAAKDDPDEIEYVVGLGADVDVLTDSGYTPLFIAASQGHAMNVDALLNAGADPAIRCGENRGSAFHVACAQGFPEVVETLLRFDESLTNADLDGSTPLHLTAEVDRSDVADVLLNHGADPVKRYKGATPLHLAASLGYHKTVGVLLKHGVDPDARDADGCTPRDLAKRAGHTAVLNLLDQPRR